MGWNFFDVIYELVSPLHIGYRKIGNLQQTRYYIPARNIWAAVTERFSRCGFAGTPNATENNYRPVGTWVKEHFSFGYWFVHDDGTLLYPTYESGQVKYGNFEVAEFERLYVSSLVTTALESATTSAATGSLHEVEFVAAYTSSGQRTSMGGWVIVHDEAIKELGKEDIWNSWLKELYIGGERRYGFGKLLLKRYSEATNDTNYEFIKHTPRPQVKVKGGHPLLGHAISTGFKAKGMIEPYVGRETDKSDRFGIKTLYMGVCWVPGSSVCSDETFELDESGLWKRSLS